MNPKRLGDYGERIACYYLENNKYRILDRNYTKEWSSISKGEIDIVVEKEKIISFVEVKTIASAFSAGAILPEDKVNFQKQRQLIKLAQSWLSEKKISLESKWQIDVISIKIDLNSKKAKIRHLKNAISF